MSLSTRSTICSPQRVQQLPLVGEAQAFQERLVDLGQLQRLDVLELQADLHVLAGDLRVRVLGRHGHVQRLLVADLHALDLLGEVRHLHAGDAAGAGDELGVALVGDVLPAAPERHVGDQVIALLHAAVLDGHQAALLLAQVAQRLLHVLVADGDLGLFDLQPAHRGQVDLGLELDGEAVNQVALVGQFDALGLVENRLAQDVELAFGHGVLVALAEQVLLHLVAHGLAEALLDEVLGGLAGAEAGKAGGAADLAEGAVAVGGDAVARDGDAQLLAAGAGVLDLDGVVENVFLLVLLLIGCFFNGAVGHVAVPWVSKRGSGILARWPADSTGVGSPTMADEFSFSVDSDWKKQAQAEKRKLAEEAAQKPAAAPPAKAEAKSPAARPASRRRRTAGELPEANFTTLVQTLASQALLYLGGVAVSNGEGIVDLDTAKHQIDLLAVLEEKAGGNLSDDERATLDVTLYETRMRFVGVASRYIL